MDTKCISLETSCVRTTKKQHRRCSNKYNCPTLRRAA
jgi:hypothetical protein